MCTDITAEKSFGFIGLNEKFMEGSKAEKILNEYYKCLEFQ